MTSDSRKTVLHDWHHSHTGRMVDFAGFDMPVNYEAGTIAEHLATRRAAGLFDVSHMGRFEVGGPEAEEFLRHVLSNDAAALEPGRAHYTFIANEDGGAVDDAYLYRLEEARFLLVVNAGNRDKDWEWLESHRRGFDAKMRDVSADIAMLALQGPKAQTMLEALAGKADLPENRRNRMATVRIDGHEVLVARTGYTGEAGCFELFPETAFAVALWEKLIDQGAAPVGLGARDSLRLEASLPLYGHELGPDADGGDIPIFANAVAGAGVRKSGGDGTYVGQKALEAQRAERVAIRNGALATPVADRRLKSLIRPIAAFAGKKPLRAGFRLYRGREQVGVVTSGTSVPATHSDARGQTPVADGGHVLRPIGLALIRSDISYSPDRPVTFEIEDARGGRFEAELVEKNLWT